MAYTPTNWKDRDVENPRTYTARQNEDGSITFFDAPGEIREQGTPVNASNMNKIEKGIANSVSKTGDETIQGRKEFTDIIYRKITDLDVKTTPTSSQYFDWLSPKDKNGVNVGFFGTAQFADGAHGSRLGVTKYINGNPVHAELRIQINSVGTVTTYAPTPPASNNTTQIATTAWTRTQIKCIPNFSAKSTWGTNVNRNADVDGIIFGKWSVNSNSSLRTVLKINNVEYGVGSTSIGQNAFSFFSLPVAKGDNIEFTGETTLFFSPFKGVSL